MALNIGELVGYIGLDASEFDKGIGEAEGKFDAFGGRLGKAAAGFALAIGGALGAGIVEALDVQAGTAKLSAQLRLTQEESARVGKVAGGLYSDAYGDSLEGVNDALRALIGQMGGLGDVTDAELTRAGQKALDLGKIMGVDVTRLVQIAGQAVRTGLAGDFDEAFDLISAASAKTMPGLEDDLLDAADEYGQFFTALGIDGPAAFGMLAKASERGMYGIDKTGDAIKEFTIRSTDMSTASTEAYEAIGLDAEVMADRILAGGETAAGAFDEIVSGLLGLESPSKRANMAIALFGTPIEDLSTQEIPDFLRSLLDAESGLGDVAGAAEEMGDTLNDTAQTRITEFGRTAKMHIVDFVGGQALPAITSLADAATGVLGPAWESVTGWLADHKDTAVEYLTPIVDAAGRLWEQLGVLWDSLTEGEGALTMAGELLGVAGGGLLFLVQQAGPAIDLLADLVGWFAELPAPVQASVLALAGLTLLRPQIAGVADAVGTRFTRAMRGARDISDEARLRFMYLGDAASGAASGGVAGLTRAIGRGAGSGLRAAAGGLLTIMGGPLGLAIAGVSLALGFLAKKHMEAKQAAAEQEATADELGSTLDQRTGAITRQTQELIAQRAAEEGVLDIADQLGLAHGVLTRAALDDADAQRMVADAIKEAESAALTSTDVWREVAGQLEAYGVSSDEVARVVRRGGDAQAYLEGKVNDAGVAMMLHQGVVLAVDEAQRQTAEGTEALTGFIDIQRAAFESEAEAILRANEELKATDPGPLTEQIGALADETANADTQARALDDALRLLAGGSLSLEEAQGRANEAVRRVTEAIEAATEEADGNASALFTNTGAIDTTTDAGWRLFQSVESAREGMAREAQAARDLAIANGEDAKGGMDAATEAAQRVREAFIQAAVEAGLSEDAAKALADQYGLIPGNVTTTLEAVDDASGKIDAASGKVDDFDRKSGTAEISAHAYTMDAESDINHAARDRTTHIFVRQTPIGGGGSGTVDYKADGGIVGAANGLLREPMIAAAGSNILWAEPETGGEAYIPLGMSKRSRSLDLLAQVAEMFGYGLVATDPIAAIASAFGGSGSGSTVLQDMLEGAARQVVRLGEVTEEDWQTLLRLGWSGRAGDGMEALYPPLRVSGQEFVRLGDVTGAEWRALKAMGWEGRAGDHMEALYPPMDDTRGAFEDLARAVREEERRLRSRMPAGTWEPGPTLQERFARGLLGALQSGATVWEDWSWRGMSDRFTDDLRLGVMDDYEGGSLADYLRRYLGGSMSAAAQQAAPAGKVEQHHHYHLDSAAAATVARQYAEEVDTVRRRRDNVLGGVG